MLLFITAEAKSQQEGFIYGEIRLKNKQLYTGQIKWSGGQMLWSDILLVSKQINPNLKYLNEYQLNDLREDSDKSSLDWRFMNLWEDKYPERKSEILSCFGDISLIHITGENEAQIYYKNGFKYRVTTDEREGRHLGKDIIVYSNELARTIKWSAISTIKFSSSPSSAGYLKGNSLYGTIITTNGPVSGYIQWDKTKYLDNQYLNGKVNGLQSAKYEFADIVAIERADKGAVVTLKSRKKVYLTGDRDVMADNKGIVVMHPLWGRIIVEWKAFRSAEFTSIPIGLGYESYPKPKKIYGTVKTKDHKVFKGNCVFDMDEEWNYELLEGNKDGMYYQIPFKYISKLFPLNQSYSKVVLLDNKALILGHHNDVTAKNWGVLVWLANSEYKYIPWNMISEISFR